MSKYNLTKKQLGCLYDITKLTIEKNSHSYTFNSLTKESLILTNEAGTDLAISLNDIKKMLHAEMVDSPTSDQSVGNGSMSNTSLDTKIFKPSKNNNNRDDETSTMRTEDMKHVKLSTTSDMSKKGGYNDATSSMNPNMFRNVSLSETSDMPNQNGGHYKNKNNNDNDATSSMNPNMFKNVSLSATSDMPNNQHGGHYKNNNDNDATSSINPNMLNNVNLSTTSDMPNQHGGNNDVFSSMNTNIIADNLFVDSSAMSSTLDLSEVSGLSNRNNNNIFNTSNNMNGGYNSNDQKLNLIRKKLQEIGVSSQQEMSYTHANAQKGGNMDNKRILSKKALNEIGINSSSTSDFCQ